MSKEQNTEPTCPHCAVRISEHPASRCLDAWVAEAVMGWKVEVDEELGVYWYKNGSLFSADVDQYPHNTSSWCPSRHIARAWEAVGKLNQSGYIVEIINDCVAWSVVFRNIDTDERFTSDWKTSLEVQVCRAAIKARQG